jgi:hypothetical protein
MTEATVSPHARQRMIAKNEALVRRCDQGNRNAPVRQHLDHLFAPAPPRFDANLLYHPLDHFGRPEFRPLYLGKRPDFSHILFNKSRQAFLEVCNQTETLESVRRTLLLVIDKIVPDVALLVC